MVDDLKGTAVLLSSQRRLMYYYSRSELVKR